VEVDEGLISGCSAALALALVLAPLPSSSPRNLVPLLPLSLAARPLNLNHRRSNSQSSTN
jgi:hypothetical protein